MAHSKISGIVRSFNLFITAGIFLLFSGCVSDKEEPVWSLVPGDKLPDFAVEVNGAIVTTESLRGSKSVIVLFDTECPDCRAALPDIQKAYDEAIAEGENIRYLCISREEGEDEISRYWKENNLTLPFSAQTSRTVYNLFASSIIPRVYISDENLIIQKVYE